MNDLKLLAIFAGLVLMGYATCWLLMRQTIRRLYDTMAEQQRTIARLRQQVTQDVTTICDLQERLDTNERAAGLWRSFETMQGKN